ncbi:MAG: hypothetical protein ABIY50_03295 [Ignavibacteria bacterium]
MSINENFAKTIEKYLPADKKAEFIELMKAGDKVNIEIFIYTILGDLEKIIEENLEEIIPRSKGQQQLE